MEAWGACSLLRRIFQDEAGNYIYGFSEDETGEKLYAAVQDAVDSARNEGAEIVILVGHLGRNYVTERWSSESVLANTTGIDAMIDGHSHEEYTTTVKNKNGEEVLLSGGDGMTMFTGCNVLMRDITTDVDALYTYINQDLGGVIGEEYADPSGQGRITIR